MLLLTTTVAIRLSKLSLMLYLHLKPIFEARGIDRPFSFLVKAGFTYHTTHNILNGNASSIRFDHLEDLCRILVCEPNDILAWQPDKGVHYPAQNPLAKLKPTYSVNHIQQAMTAMPYKDLIQLVKDTVPKNEDEGI